MSQTPDDQEFFLQPILSTYVRSGRVGEAIALAGTEQALNHLALLISTDKLYEEALATYNLEKALKIAGKLRFFLNYVVTFSFQVKICNFYLLGYFQIQFGILTC